MPSYILPLVVSVNINLPSSASSVNSIGLKHLNEVCNQHQITISKKHPAINDYNELLKTNNVIDIPVWRNIQRLADLRNLCDHHKNTEPTKEDIEELIIGTDKVLKTIF